MSFIDPIPPAYQGAPSDLTYELPFWVIFHNTFFLSDKTHTFTASDEDFKNYLTYERPSAPKEGEKLHWGFKDFLKNKDKSLYEGWKEEGSEKFQSRKWQTLWIEFLQDIQVNGFSNKFHLNDNILDIAGSLRVNYIPQASERLQEMFSGLLVQARLTNAALTIVSRLAGLYNKKGEAAPTFKETTEEKDGKTVTTYTQTGGDLEVIADSDDPKTDLPAATYTAEQIAKLGATQNAQGMGGLQVQGLNLDAGDDFDSYFKLRSKEQADVSFRLKVTSNLTADDIKDLDGYKDTSGNDVLSLYDQLGSLITDFDQTSPVIKVLKQLQDTLKFKGNSDVINKSYGDARKREKQWKEWQELVEPADMLRTAIVELGDMNEQMRLELKRQMFVMDEFYKSASTWIEKLRNMQKTLTQKMKG